MFSTGVNYVVGVADMIVPTVDVKVYLDEGEEPVARFSFEQATCHLTDIVIEEEFSMTPREFTRIWEAVRSRLKEEIKYGKMKSNE